MVLKRKGVCYEVLLVVLIVLATAGFVSGQYNPAGYSTGVCATWLGAPSSCTKYLSSQIIWVPDNDTQSQIANENSPLLNNVYNAVPLILDCQTKATRFICGNALRSCLTYDFTVNNATLQFSVGSPVCRSVCDDFVNSCGPLLTEAGQGQLIPNCSEEAGSVPLYPDQGQNVTLTFYGKQISIQCVLPPTPSKPCYFGVLNCSSSTLTNFIKEISGILSGAVAFMEVILGLFHLL